MVQQSVFSIVMSNTTPICSHHENFAEEFKQSSDINHMQTFLNAI